MNSVAEIVKTARQSSGLSMTELERRAKLSKGVVSRIENNKVSPTTDTLIAIMRVLNYEIVIKPRYTGGYKKR